MNQLNRIAELTAGMSQAANDGEWSRVWEMDEERYGLLLSLPPSLFDSGDSAVSGILEQALTVTHEVLARARECRVDHASDLLGLHRAQRGASAYLNVG